MHRFRKKLMRDVWIHIKFKITLTLIVRKTRDLSIVPICSQFNINVIFNWDIKDFFSFQWICAWVCWMCVPEKCTGTWHESFFLFLVNAHPTLCWTLTTTVTRFFMQNREIHRWLTVSLSWWQIAGGFQVLGSWNSKSEKKKKKVCNQCWGHVHYVIRLFSTNKQYITF